MASCAELRRSAPPIARAMHDRLSPDSSTFVRKSRVGCGALEPQREGLGIWFSVVLFWGSTGHPELGFVGGPGSPRAWFCLLVQGAGWLSLPREMGWLSRGCRFLELRSQAARPRARHHMAERKRGRVRRSSRFTSAEATPPRRLREARSWCAGAAGASLPPRSTRVTSTLDRGRKPPGGRASALDPPVDHALNEEPQPQEPFEFGLLNLNPAPWSPST